MRDHPRHPERPAAEDTARAAAWATRSGATALTTTVTAAAMLAADKTSGVPPGGAAGEGAARGDQCRMTRIIVGADAT